MNRSFILFTAILFITLSAFTFRPADNSEWTQFHSFNGVDFYQKEVVKKTSDYEHAYVVFKYVNTTDQSVNINWKLNLWIGDHCRSCKLPSPSEYDMQLNLKPGESISGTIQDTDKMLRLFKKDLQNTKMQELSKFEFANMR